MCPENLQYTKEHEWIRMEDESAVIGITDYAQEQLGDVVYVELPDEGIQLTQFEVCGTIESVKTVSDLYAPLSGEVLRVNEALDETPELMNNEPYGAGWIAEIRLSDPGELDNLLSVEEYEELIRAES
jgi:glycine cleavage system H protein